MAAVNLEKLELKFLSELDTRDDFCNFLKFAAVHPELSFDNICLLYFQDPEAPRYVVHKGIADHYGYSTEKPVGLYDLMLNNGSPEYKNGIFYMVPPGLVLPQIKADIQFAAIFSRIGYELTPSDEVTGLVKNTEFRRLIYPKRWTDIEKNDILLGFIVDYFWTAYKDRDSIIHITDEQFRKIYRSGLLYLATVLLGYKEPVMNRQFYITMRDKYARKKRLSDLFFLFVELDQMLEGRHFTVYESLLFRLSNGNPYNDVIAINSPDPRDPFVSYEMMLLRYVNDRLEDIPIDTVHIYPPYRYDRN